MSDAPSPIRADRQTVFRVFFFGAFLFLLYQLIRIMSPFFTPLMVAVTLTLVFYPLHAWLGRRWKDRPGLAAGLSTGVILLIVIVPAILFFWVLIREASVLTPWIQARILEFRQGDLDTSLPQPLSVLWAKVQRFLTFWEIDPQDIFLKNVDELGTKMSAFGTGLVKNVVFLIFEIVITAFTLFFFFRDGKKFVRFIVDLVPMESGHKEHILERLDQTLSAVVRGTFITAFVQGLLAGTGFGIAGIKFAVVLGFATAFTALIPFVGAAAVWIPVSVVVLLKGHMYKGAFLIAWGVLVVSLVDNFMKPILIGEKAKLPIFLLFFGILGGLQVYGFLGVLLGPLMIACVLAFAKIYKEQMQHRAPARHDAEAPPAG